MNKDLDEIVPLIYATEIRDAYTQGHSEHVAYYAKEFASFLGLDKKECEKIYIAGLLHDIGKIGIPDSVLLKPGKLENDEYDLIKLHSDISGKIVERLPNFSYLQKVVRHHHEDYNGQGYPDGLKGEEIPFHSRILSLVDVFDALTTGRIYRAPMSFEHALSIMKNMQQNGKFDPELFESFMNFIKKFGIYKDDTVQSLEFKELETKRNTFFYTDNLTNLLNREALVSLLKKSHDYGYDVSLIICNIKKFKLYNRQYGLTKGDALLKNIAQQLQEILDVQAAMKEPQYKDLFAFRPSADRFVLFFIGRRSEFLAYKIEKIVKTFEENFQVTLECDFIIRDNKVGRNIEQEIGYLL